MAASLLGISGGIRTGLNMGNMIKVQKVIVEKFEKFIRFFSFREPPGRRVVRFLPSDILLFRVSNLAFLLLFPLYFLVFYHFWLYLFGLVDPTPSESKTIQKCATGEKSRVFFSLIAFRFVSKFLPCYFLSSNISP